MKKILGGAWLVVALFGFAVEAGAQESMKKDPMKRAETAIQTFAEGCAKHHSHISIVICRFFNNIVYVFNSFRCSNRRTAKLHHFHLIVYVSLSFKISQFDLIVYYDKRNLTLNQVHSL